MGLSQKCLLVEKVAEICDIYNKKRLLYDKPVQTLPSMPISDQRN